MSPMARRTVLLLKLLQTATCKAVRNIPVAYLNVKVIVVSVSL